jgi:hypothetical protein
MAVCITLETEPRCRRDGINMLEMVEGILFYQLVLFLTEFLSFKTSVHMKMALNTFFKI